jgi:hypothetical protein
MEMNNIIFCVSNAYIAEKFVTQLVVDSREKSRIFLIVSRTGVSRQLEEKYKYLIYSRNIGEILWIEDFNLSKILPDYYKTIRSIKDFINTNKKYSKFYIQSMNDYVSRYVADKIKKRHSSILTIGLTLSIPVFLIREPCYTKSLLKEDCNLRRHLKARCEKLKKYDPHRINKDYLSKIKEKTVQVLDYIFDRLTISKKFRLEKIVVVTSYVKKGIVDYHLSVNPYWSYCLKMIYQEKVITEKSDHPDTEENALFIDRSQCNKIIILGPTMKDMVYCYVEDIKHILKYVSVEKILIRPHPRHLLESKMLLNLLTKSEDIPVANISNKSYDVDFGLLNYRSIVLGYYSTIFEDLPCNKFLCLLSEGANHLRYPYLDSEVLSGNVADFGTSLKKISKGGKWR